MFGKEIVKTKPEIASFAYIEEMLDRALEKKVKPTAAHKDAAKLKSRAIVAGFPVFDPVKERAELDAIVAKREKEITKFITDRKTVRENLDKLGIKPLAVVPIKAWVDICAEAGLNILRPDANGKVAINQNALRRYGNPGHAESAAKSNYTKFVCSLLAAEEKGNTSWVTYPTVILPTPPQDVVDTLLKARSLALKTAAVPEAIRFAETPTEIWNNAAVDQRDVWARAQGYADYKDWVKRDPIVYHEHGSAAAIIAQFGDFPIEKKVVETVMEGDDLIPESVGQAIIRNPLSGAAYYANEEYDRYRRMTEDQLRQSEFASGLAFAQIRAIGGGSGGSGVASWLTGNRTPGYYE